MPLITNYTSLGQALQDFAQRGDIASYQDYFIQSAQEQIEKDILDQNFGNGIRYQEVAYPPSLITGGTLPLPADWMAPKVFTVTDAGGLVNPLIFKAAAWLYDTYPIRQADNVPAYIARDVIAPASFNASLDTSGNLTVNSVSGGAVVPGMVITDGAVNLPAALPGSAIIVTGQGSGPTGGVGAYTAQSVSPASPTFTVAAEGMSGGGSVFVFGPYPDSGYQVQGTYYQTAPMLSLATTNWMVQYAPMTLLAYCMIEVARFLKDTAMMQYWQTQAQAACKGLVDKDKAERWAASTMQVEVG